MILLLKTIPSYILLLAVVFARVLFVCLVAGRIGLCEFWRYKSGRGIV